MAKKEGLPGGLIFLDYGEIGDDLLSEADYSNLDFELKPQAQLKSDMEELNAQA